MGSLAELAFMSRIIICIPFFLFFALLYPRQQPVNEPEPIENFEQKVAAAPDPKKKSILPEPDVVTFLEKCLERYDKEVKGYTTKLYKQERVHGKLLPHELVYAEFKENPHSVYMKWLEGAGDALAAVYVKGENNDKLLAKPKIFPLITWTEDPRGEKAKRNGRYTIDEFGIKIGTQRVLRTWSKKKAEGKLQVECEGIFKVERAGNRECYKIHRTGFEHPEEDGVFDVVIYIDTETWLQVGSTLRDQKGQLIADYYFSDIRLNPDFPPNHFSRDLLKK
jgi:hypothetical protein